MGIVWSIFFIFRILRVATTTYLNVLWMSLEDFTKQTFFTFQTRIHDDLCSHLVFYSLSSKNRIQDGKSKQSLLIKNGLQVAFYPKQLLHNISNQIQINYTLKKGKFEVINLDHKLHFGYCKLYWSIDGKQYWSEILQRYVSFVT